MVLSMTGFGRSFQESSFCSVTVEIKTVNHRFCEFAIRTPRQLMKTEEKIKKILSQYIKRGRVEVFISVSGEGTSKKSLQVDWSLLSDYYQFIHEVKNRFDVSDAVDLRDLIQFSEVISVEETAEENGQLESMLLLAMDEAAQQLMNMRCIEGNELKKDLIHHLEVCSSLTGSIRTLAPSVVKEYQSRLEKRIQEYAKGLVEESRVMTEIAIYADKVDITEELTRLESHISQFKQTLELSEPMGRKLDFMIQEMNREVNTIGSKANHAKISSLAIELKTTLEKLREQAQNIE